MQQSVAFLHPGSIVRYVSDTSQVLFPTEFRGVPAELPASWILTVQWIAGTSWQFNREHRSRVRAVERSYRSCRSFGLPAHTQRTCSTRSVRFLLSPSFSCFRTNHPLSSLSRPRVSYLLIFLSTVKTRRRSTTKRVGTNSVSRQKHRRHYQWHSQQGTKYCKDNWRYDWMKQISFQKNWYMYIFTSQKLFYYNL